MTVPRRRLGPGRGRPAGPVGGRKHRRSGSASTPVGPPRPPTGPPPAILDNFITENSLDRNAASELRGCPPEIQRTILWEGVHGDIRNPSAFVCTAMKLRRKEKKMSGSYGPPQTGAAQEEEESDGCFDAPSMGASTPHAKPELPLPKLSFLPIKRKRLRDA